MSRVFTLADRPANPTHTLGVGMSVQERDPCPHRIFDDIGGAFAMGAIGGGVWNSVKGARNSPRGEFWQGTVTVFLHFSWDFACKIYKIIRVHF